MPRRLLTSVRETERSTRMRVGIHSVCRADCRSELQLVRYLSYSIPQASEKGQEGSTKRRPKRAVPAVSASTVLSTAAWRPSRSRNDRPRGAVIRLCDTENRREPSSCPVNTRHSRSVCLVRSENSHSSFLIFLSACLIFHPTSPIRPFAHRILRYLFSSPFPKTT